MTTKNWTATAAAGKRLTGKRKQSRAAVHAAAVETLEPRQLLSAVLDTSFGTGGKVIDGVGTVGAITMEPDGKILVGGDDTNGNFVLKRFDAAGVLDLSFGGSGTVTIPTTGLIGVIGLAIEQTPADLANPWKIVAVGQSKPSQFGTASDFRVVRLLSNGSLDTTFGAANTGIVDTPPTYPIVALLPTSVATASDGSIVVGGNATFAITGDTEFELAKYTPTGQLDGTFGTGGLVTTPVGAGGDLLRTVVVEPDNSILVGGQASLPVTGNSAVAVHYSSFGAFDGNFGGGTGMATTGSGDGAALVRQSDGSILLGGFNGTDSALTVGKFDSAGAVVSGFGSGGVASVALAGMGDAPVSMGVQSNGRIVLGTSSGGGAADDFTTVGLTAGGVPDSTYGTNGIVTTDLNSGSQDQVGGITSPVSAGNGLVVDSSDRIVVAGRAVYASQSHVSLVRYVTALPAQVDYSGNTIANADALGNVTFRLRATVIASSGDVTTATVTFKIFDGATLVDTVAGSPVGLTGTGAGVGDSKASKTVALTGTSHIYRVQVVVSGTYTGSTDGNDMLVAEQAGGSASGAGFIVAGSSSAGLFAADAGSKISFGFNVKEQSGTFTGEVHLIFSHTVSGVLHTYEVDSQEITSFGRNTSTGQANFIARVTLTDVTDRGHPAPMAQNLTLQVSLTDTPTRPSTQSIAFTLWDGTTLDFSNDWDGFDSVEDVLRAGTLVVR